MSKNKQQSWRINNVRFALLYGAGPRVLRDMLEEVQPDAQAKVFEFDLIAAENSYQKLLEELHNYGKPAGNHDDVADDMREPFDNISD